MRWQLQSLPLGGLSLRLVNTEPWLRYQRCSNLGGSLLSNFIPCFQNLCLSCRWIQWSLVLKLSPKIKRIMRINIKSLKENLLKKKSCWQTVKVDKNYVPLVIMSTWNGLLEHGYCKTHIVYWIAHLQTHLEVKHMGIYASCLLKNIKILGTCLQMSAVQLPISAYTLQIWYRGKRLPNLKVSNLRSLIHSSLTVVTARDGQSPGDSTGTACLSGSAGRECCRTRSITTRQSTHYDRTIPTAHQGLPNASLLTIFNYTMYS